METVTHSIPAMVPDPVALDPELEVGLRALEAAPGVRLTAETIEEHRAADRNATPPIEDVIAGRPVLYEDRLVPGGAGGDGIIVAILRPDGPTSGAGLVNLHGGGMMVGSRFSDAPNLVDWVVSLGLVVIAVEYRLAPEHPDPVPSEDCYAALGWAADHAAELGFSPDRLVVQGGSAGGGLSAAVSLMARDRGGPRLAGQLLLCPMIDDRGTSASMAQHAGTGPWDRAMNEVGWQALLGERYGSDQVSPYAAPARATDLADLAPAFIEVGAAEIFRDEDIAYASRIWASGGQAELHVWPGAYHGFDRVCPDAAITRAAKATRASWLRRVLDL